MTSSSSSSNREERRAAIEAKLREGVGTNHGMGRFSDSLMRSLRIDRYDEGNDNSPVSLILSFQVSQDLCNSFDTLHGGAQATAVDIFTSILLYQVSPVPSVTTDLHVSCVSPAPLGSRVICVCKADKHNGALQFSSCDLYREVADGEGILPPTQRRRRVLVAKGLHTKYVLKKRAKGFGREQQRSKL
jgi:acyl-coenzyme A thioesterase 13